MYSAQGINMTDEQMTMMRYYLAIVSHKTDICRKYITNMLNRKDSAPDVYTEIHCLGALYQLEEITNNLSTAIEAIAFSQMDSEISDTEES